MQPFTISYCLKPLLNHKLIFLKRITVLTAALLLIVLQACKKDPSVIGLDIHPQSDKVTAATLSFSGINAFTFSEDSLSTDERSLALLGSYNDPVFGLTSASFISQVRLSSLSLDFGTSVQADSICLYIDYTSFYGDSTVSQNINIYELANSIYPDSIYYSNFDANTVINPVPLHSFTYTPRPNDSCLTIKLPIELAQRFIAAPSSIYEDNAAFLEFFKGLCFMPDASLPGGGIAYFNLLSTKTYMILYYTNQDGPQTYNFSINTNCARINLFNHNYGNSMVTGINDSVTSHSSIYMQAMSGLGMKIYFPGLTSWKDSGDIIISKAELIIPVNTSFNNSLYTSPSKLLNVGITSSGTYEFLSDYVVGEAYFNGKLNEETQEYRFNIGRYIQSLVDGTKTDNGIAVLCSDNRVSSNRVVINNSNVTGGLRLEIYYFKP